MNTLIHPGRRASSELVLGRYRLLERLGAGGFGVVWAAHDEQLDREVALKRIEVPSREDSERATREALACARLAHSAIVALYEACAQEDAFYLISELVHGRTLAALLADGELDDERVLEVGLAVAGALGHAHARGVIHRDVKPSNVIVCEPDRESRPAAKLADFGGAQLVGEDALTRTGDVLGTLAYMAPEQSEGHEVGAPADVYSLALVVYEALSGVNPVRGPTPAATARRIGRPIEPLARHRRDLGRDLTETINAALHPDPDERAQLVELEQALQDALQARSRTSKKASHARARARTRVSHFRDTTHTHSSPERPIPEQSHQPAPTTARQRAPAAGEAPAAPPEPDALQAGHRRERLALPRVVWLATLVGVATWQAALGLPGVSLLVLAAGAPLLAVRRFSIAWLSAALAPALGTLGLAGAFPALGGQRARWRERAALAALGFWWLALAEPLLGRRLWEGPAAGLPARSAWEGSLQLTASHVIAPAVTVQLLVGIAVWAAAAAVLPLVVRGRSAALDVAGALTWTIALLAAVPLLQRSALAHATHASPRGALLGAVLGCVLAVCARALRGPVLSVK
ncbi:MAG: protein kinase domain-containing protein [Solirubrobacteraceae bacterium]